jgi:hypothetical protein
VIEFLQAMNDIIRAGEPVARKCRGCGGGGELPDGGHCNWCAPDEGEPLEDDISLADALRNMGIEP